MPGFESEVVFVTDASSDLGELFVDRFLAQGAARVYAGGRQPRDWSSDRVVAVELDVRDIDTIERARAEASDATILLNNDGLPEWPPVTVGGGDLAAVAAHLDTNVVGAIRLASAFAPVLAGSPRSVILMVYSVQAWINLSGAYAVSQAALWSATNALRVELAPAGVHVAGLVLGLCEADPGLDAIVDRTLAGIAARDYEITVDAYSEEIKARLSAPIPIMYPELVSP
ncbi:SDR family NAD(P)-dependent oxidoreductase [Plantactinospora soyae]|uniref:NAD(P)-dependent dehydrogenase (Short-subunit alcohol dehydrogenase family) n=1 Tax=Plantactinospora soyae TaxID=1544732 RepID=A0A927RA99_9ACTN|nr:SDR family NAD(P)-dependent oxidoreductase [Plantactinospora soyae]MBE1490561.1 NAD(P)-dependent dehydrogenase (short-subunit alcohol dehydrogenase family) [Plantactinospora soyae]